MQVKRCFVSIRIENALTRDNLFFTRKFGHKGKQSTWDFTTRKYGQSPTAGTFMLQLRKIKIKGGLSYPPINMF